MKKPEGGKEISLLFYDGPPDTGSRRWEKRVACYRGGHGPALRKCHVVQERALGQGSIYAIHISFVLRSGGPRSDVAESVVSRHVWGGSSRSEEGG